MNKSIKQAVRQVLKDAGNAPYFFDLSGGEQINWMIARAFALGTQHRAKHTNKTGGRCNESRHRR